MDHTNTTNRKPENNQPVMRGPTLHNAEKKPGMAGPPCRKIGTPLGKKAYKNLELQGFLWNSSHSANFYNMVCILTSISKALLLVGNLIYGEQPAEK
jgi:hypothetical protein